MELFFKLEAGYIGIGIFALLITLFVSTRPFMPKGSYKKKDFLLLVYLWQFSLVCTFM